MKTLIFVAIVCLWSQPISAKPINMDCDTLHKLVVKVMESKHHYEASIMLASSKNSGSSQLYEMEKEALLKTLRRDSIETPDNALAAHKEAIERFKGQASRFSDLADPQQKQLFYDYDFMHPFNSILIKENMISYSDCISVLSHFLLDQDRDTLPPLTEALDFLGREISPPLSTVVR